MKFRTMDRAHGALDKAGNDTMFFSFSLPVLTEILSSSFLVELIEMSSLLFDYSLSLDI